MSELKYLVIEYLPHTMDGHEFRPARIDGHYSDVRDAQEIAALWAESPLQKESRIVVSEIMHEAKAPAHWRKGAA